MTHVGQPASTRQSRRFLSYASQASEAVERIANALRSIGVEVWFNATGRALVEIYDLDS